MVGAVWQNGSVAEKLEIKPTGSEDLLKLVNIQDAKARKRLTAGCNIGAAQLRGDNLL